MTNKIKLIENTDLDEFKKNLKFTRESKNITIENASKLLNININILQNIENANSYSHNCWLSIFCKL